MNRTLISAAILLLSAITATAQAPGKHASATTPAGQTAQAPESLQENCFSIIAGRLTTVDGSVLFAHNEDDAGEQMMNLYNMPADPAAGTLAYKWIEFPGMKVADGFMNEYGVSICSDSCGSREDCEPGEWLYEIRTSVAKYAKSAREAVEIIGRAVEEHGYHDSGRSYMVADPNEGWIVSLVKGRHWVAMRVPDDQVLVIPNYHVIDRVDLADTANFAGAPDLIDYAIARGWYDPEKDGEFSFRRAYGRPSTFTSTHNTERHRDVLAALTDGTYEYSVETVQPMITPSRKLSVADLTAALSIHGEDDGSGKHLQNVCMDRTVASVVFQLRKDMPLEVGCLMWLCPGRPCAEAFLPVYLGATKLPEDFGRYESAAEAQEKHFSDVGDFRTKYPVSFYWYQADRWESLSEDYAGRIAQRQAVRDAAQAKIYAAQEKLEKKVARLLAKGRRGPSARAERRLSKHLAKCADLCR